MTQMDKLRPQEAGQGKWDGLKVPFAGPVCRSGGPVPSPHGVLRLRRQLWAAKTRPAPLAPWHPPSPPPRAVPAVPGVEKESSQT